MKKFIIYSLIIGFFLSFFKWDNLYIGIINFSFASLFTWLNFVIFQKILELIGNYYGIVVNLDRFIIKKEVKVFSHIKKEVVTKTSFLPLDYILTSLIGFLTYSLFFPILLTVRFNVIESKRYGKTKDYEIKYEEKVRILFYAMVVFWLFVSTIKYFSKVNPIIFAYFTYTYNFLLMLTISYLIPFNLVLSYILIKKLGYEYLGVSPGDILIFSKTTWYKAVVVAIAFLPIFSLFLDPISTIILILIVFSTVWLRSKFSETI